jgi:hypothetical protein
MQLQPSTNLGAYPTSCADVSANPDADADADADRDSWTHTSALVDADPVGRDFFDILRIIDLQTTIPVVLGDRRHGHAERVRHDS